jgi:hypothetical protein
MHLFSIFHINTRFSSIEKEDLKKVLQYCYEPLINLASDKKNKITIEASGLSLLDINKLSKDLIKKLQLLIHENRCNFVGSGYAQIIGPLNPYKVNYHNINYGNKIYKRLLNFRPDIAYVNEQAYSKSLILSYLKNNYKTIISEWNNTTISANSKFSKFEFLPIVTGDDYGNKINIIWNNSVAFQKFQKYIHDEIDYEEYFSYLEKKKKSAPINSYFSIYGSDVEVFDYRPGRYKYELKNKKNEWKKIELLYKKINLINDYQFVFPKEIITTNALLKDIGFITDATRPIIVKKQSNYNITRWALSGRNNIFINSFCQKLYNYLLLKKRKISIWHSLCELSGSDYRTHITIKKWNKLIYEINKYKKKILPKIIKVLKVKKHILEVKKNFYFTYKKVILSINSQKGFVITKFLNKDLSYKNIFGKIEQGFFNSIEFDVNYFSNYFIFTNYRKKISDINIQNTKLLSYEKNNLIYFEQKENIGSIFYIKNIILNKKNGELGLGYKFKKIPYGILRLFYITINPNFFIKNKISYETHNGGLLPEKFIIKNKSFDHCKSFSALTSANCCLGATENTLKITDSKKTIEFTIDKNKSKVFPMISYDYVNNKNLLRIIFSASEIDDTSKFKDRDLEALIWIKTYKN